MGAGSGLPGARRPDLALHDLDAVVEVRGRSKESVSKLFSRLPM